MVLAYVKVLAFIMLLARVMVLAHVMIVSCIMVLARVMVLAPVMVLVCGVSPCYGVSCVMSPWRGSHGLRARRARRTKSRGQKGLQLEVGARIKVHPVDCITTIALQQVHCNTFSVAIALQQVFCNKYTPA